MERRFADHPWLVVVLSGAFVTFGVVLVVWPESFVGGYRAPDSTGGVQLLGVVVVAFFGFAVVASAIAIRRRPPPQRRR